MASDIFFLKRWIKLIFVCLVITDAPDDESFVYVAG